MGTLQKSRSLILDSRRDRPLTRLGRLDHSSKFKREAFHIAPIGILRRIRWDRQRKPGGEVLE